MDNTEDYNWLVNVARSSPVKALRDITPKLVPEVIVSQSAVSAHDKYLLVQDVIDFVNHASQQLLLPGEFPQEALWAYHVDYFRAQVNNGGIGQYLGNSGFDAVTSGSCERGLEALKLDALLDLFREIRDFAVNEPQRTAELAASYGFGDKPAHVSAWEERYYAHSATIVDELNAWIRDWPSLNAVSVPLADALQSIALPPQVAERRRRAHAAMEEARRAKDPYFVVTRRLIGSGVKILNVAPSMRRLRGLYWLDGDGGTRRELAIVYDFETDHGSGTVLLLRSHGLLKRPRAFLTSWMARKPVASCSLSLAEYESFINVWTGDL